MPSAPASSESVRDALREKLQGHEEWHIRAVETSAAAAELAYGDIGEERATIEVIRGQNETDVYLHHIDYPTRASRMAGDDAAGIIPGQLALLEFDDFESAIQSVQPLLGMSNYNDLAEWALENDYRETEIKERIAEYRG